MNSSNLDKEETGKLVDLWDQGELWRRVAGESFLGACMGNLIEEIGAGKGAAVGAIIAAGGWLIHNGMAEFDDRCAKTDKCVLPDVTVQRQTQTN